MAKKYSYLVSKDEIPDVYRFDFEKNIGEQWAFAPDAWKENDDVYGLMYEPDYRSVSEKEAYEIMKEILEKYK